MGEDPELPRRIGEESSDFAESWRIQTKRSRGRRYSRLLLSELTPAARDVLKAAQAVREEFRKYDATFEGLLLFEGGSMQSLITMVAMEAETLSRIARLTVLENYSDDPDYVNG
ncbi:MAG: hypothetical protein GDA52_06895 [Rhodobacteraceae bacterium]|nr:hypothetical protein [Paracoccaceae bacterium]